MERDEEGRLRLTEAEAEVVRAALFVALHHQDEVLGHCSGCFQTITGVEEAQVKAVMADLDELNGHNARVAEWIAAELERVARMTDDELSAATFLPDLIRSAEERGLSIPPKLKDRAQVPISGKIASMPLTPEDVAGKRFRTVRFKEGYDETDVDAFLEEVEAELRRLNARIAELEAERP